MGGFTLRGRWQARGAKGSQKRSITRFTARLSISPPMATTARRSRRRGNWARWRPRPVTHRRLSAVASTFAGDHAGVRDHAQYVLGHPSSLSGKTRINGMFFDHGFHRARCLRVRSGCKELATRRRIVRRRVGPRPFGRPCAIVLRSRSCRCSDCVVARRTSCRNRDDATASLALAGARLFHLAWIRARLPGGFATRCQAHAGRADASGHGSAPARDACDLRRNISGRRGSRTRRNRPRRLVYP